MREINYIMKGKIMKNYKWLLLTFLFISNLFGQIEIGVDGLKRYNVTKLGNSTYSVKLNENNQTLIKLIGAIPYKDGYHKVTWKTTNKYFWSNSIATDEFKVVNPTSYSKDGTVYTMFGPLPEMKGKTVKITATWGDYTDTIKFKLN